MSRLLPTLAGCLALAVLLACGDSNSRGASGVPLPLRFSAIPDQNSTELTEKFARVATYLSGALKVPVQYQPSADYTAAVELFKNEDVQLAWFGGLTHLQALAAVPGARAIAQGTEDLAFTSTFIAHRDTGIEPGAEFPRAIANYPFAFGAENSTSGRLMPEHFLQRATGLTAQQFFQHALSFSGSHDKTLALVAEGRIQCGVLSTTVYEAAVREGRIDPAEVRAIWVTPPFPDYNFTAHPSLDQRYGAGFTERLRSALLAMKDPELLAAFPRSALVAAENSDFAPLRQVAIELGLLR